MVDFWDFSVWGFLDLIAVLLLSLLVANALKRTVKFIRNSLIPTSVLGGLILLIISIVYSSITGENIFNTAFFGGNGVDALELITYHTLALGFIATSFKGGKNKVTKKRANEIFNTGVTTVSTYLLQAVFGLGITILIALGVKDFFSAAGVLLPFGYGQGTGQALNYGNIYETDFGFVGGKSFGLTIAALGFLSASIGGVIHLNILKRKKGVSAFTETATMLKENQIQSEKEIPMNGSMDKLTVQIALIVIAYVLTHLAMFGLGKLLPGMKSVIYGFNFLIGVLMATLVKLVMNLLNKGKVIKRQYTNDFLIDRIGNACFDIMVVAGIAAINLQLIKQYWWILLILGVVGLVITYLYNLLVARTLFKDYQQEQFLAMYGMLTGTASTGIMLLRELDPDFKTPVSDNLVYQNFPAIVFGFPLMLLATFAPKEPILTLIILVAFFLVMNVILFRSFIFKRRKKKTVQEEK
ncbi:MAG: hypothetical protein IJZ73_04190 [Clostridia bacterium]|nr:hypothetical protein [Clostridia bacterium]